MSFGFDHTTHILIPYTPIHAILLSFLDRWLTYYPRMLLNVTRRFSYRAIRSYTTTKPHGPSELLWGSDGAQTRISQLKSAAGETLSPFPSVFYPCIDTQQGKTLVRDFVQTYKELDNTQLHVYQSRKTTLNGANVISLITRIVLMVRRQNKSNSKTWIETLVSPSRAR